MFDHKHYVPILKAKEGELKAMMEANQETAGKLTPLFEIPAIPWDYTDEVETKTIDEHLEKLSKKILEASKNITRIFIDSDLIDGHRAVKDGTHHLKYILQHFEGNNKQAIPVTTLVKCPEYKEAVLSVVQRSNQGLCLRISRKDFCLDLNAFIRRELAYYDLSPKDVDLIVDFESISGLNKNNLLFMATIAINNAIPFLEDWRTFTLASSSFPIDLRDVDANSIETISREDWSTWLDLINNKSLKRLPAFGDYSIAHPDTVDMDPRKMTISASIRYTDDNYWLIVRGRSIKRAGWEQTHDLCSSLIERPEFCGPEYSWGDNYINECAAKKTGAGNATTWRKVGNSHHFQKVVDQISNLP